MVARLFGSQLANRWEDTKGIASQHDDVGRLLIGQAWNASVGDVLDRISAAGVLGDANVIVVGDAVERIVDDVFEDGTEADGGVDLGLLFRREVDALGVAATFDVEDTFVGPDVLVVADELTLGVGGESTGMRSGGQLMRALGCRQREADSRLASSRETEEEGNVILLCSVVG